MLTEVYITGRFAFKFKRELSIDHLLELGLLALLVPLVFGSAKHPGYDTDYIKKRK